MRKQNNVMKVWPDFTHLTFNWSARDKNPTSHDPSVQAGTKSTLFVDQNNKLEVYYCCLSEWKEWTRVRAHIDELAQNSHAA